MGIHRMALLLVGFSALAVGCQNKVHDENKALWAENRELRAHNAEMEQRLQSAPDPAQLQAMRDEIGRRDAEIARLQESLRQPQPGQNEPGLEGIDATYDPKAGTVTVDLPGDVLFASGDAALKSSARVTLDKIADAVRRNYAGRPVVIQGYTDQDPIRKTKDKWDDNFDLGYARAKAVMKYLTQKGISEKNVSIATFGPNKLKGTKAQSRRVEIVVKVK